MTTTITITAQDRDYIRCAKARGQRLHESGATRRTHGGRPGRRQSVRRKRTGLHVLD